MKFDENSCLMETLRVSHQNKHDFAGDIFMSFHGGFSRAAGSHLQFREHSAKDIEMFSWVTSLHIKNSMVRFFRSSAADGEPWWMTAEKGSGFRELRAGLSAGLSWRKGFFVYDTT